MEPDKTKIKDYAGGWITEREGTAIPSFLKLAYVVIAGGCLAYFFLYMYGEVDHADRGSLVKAMNAATEASATLMYAVAALIVVFGVIVCRLLFRQAARLRIVPCRTVSTRSEYRMRLTTGPRWSSASTPARCTPMPVAT